MDAIFHLTRYHWEYKKKNKRKKIKGKGTKTNPKYFSWSRLLQLIPIPGVKQEKYIDRLSAGGG